MGGRNFRFYISSALVFLALFVSTTVCVVLLWTLKSELEDEIADRLVNTAKLGVKIIDVDAYERLTQKLSSSQLSETELAAIEQSQDFVSISTALNELRAMKPELFVYAYTLFPTADPKVAKFVVDADVLLLRQQLKDAGKISSNLTPFNMDYKLDDQPLTVVALRDKKAVVEPSFVFDYSENVYSMMGLAPIFSHSGRFLGVLGIDASTQMVDAYLYRLFLVAVVLTAFLVALILGLALSMAHLLSRPILELTESVKKISGKDWASRIDANSKVKEIFDLKTTFNDMADRIQEYQESLVRTNESHLRFVPIEFLRFLERKDITEIKLGDQTQKDMAVLFIDIRGFTSVTEAMSPKHTFNFLNTYLSRVAPVIRQHGGFIDKYLGAGIMALFPGDCDEAVQAALGIHYEVLRFNQEREKERLPVIEIGIGVHAGVMMMGTIGEERRIQGTVIADAVNLATKVEELTLEFGVGMLITKEFYNRLKRPEVVECRFVGRALASGSGESLPLLEVYEAEPDDQRLKKNRSKPEFERGVGLLQAGNALAARAVFEAILKDNPRDKPALRFVEVCREALRRG